MTSKRWSVAVRHLAWTSAAIALLVALSVSWVSGWDSVGITRFTRVGAVATAGALIVAAVTGFAVAQQLFLLRRSFEIQMFDLTAGQIQALNRLALEYPKLRPFIYDGGLPASAEERSAAHAFAEPWLDFFDTELLRRRTFPEATANLPDFVPWVMDTFRSSAVLNERLAESEGWYSNELRGLCERARVVDASENRKVIWLGRTVGDAPLLERHGLTLKRERLVPIFVRPGDRLVEWPANGDAPVGFRVVEVGEELRDGELPVSVIKEKTALRTRGFLPGPEWRVMR